MAVDWLVKKDGCGVELSEHYLGLLGWTNRRRGGPIAGAAVVGEATFLPQD